MEHRYDRNRGTISAEENQQLLDSSVCVIGCGGLGGGVIEGLARLGVGHITAVDGDVFDVSNLNRQVLSNELVIGRPKALEAKRQMGEINSDVTVTSVVDFLTGENARSIIAGHDVVVDALDNIDARKILEQACEAEQIPLVHGAIAGWNGQVAVSMPGDRLLQTIYEGEANKGEEAETGNPSFTPAVISNLEVAEVLKLLLGRPGILKNKLLMVNLLHHEYEIIDFGE